MCKGGRAGRVRLGTSIELAKGKPEAATPSWLVAGLLILCDASTHWCRLTKAWFAETSQALPPVSN